MHAETMKAVNEIITAIHAADPEIISVCVSFVPDKKRDIAAVWLDDDTSWSRADRCAEITVADADAAIGVTTYINLENRVANEAASGNRHLALFDADMMGVTPESAAAFLMNKTEV